MIDVVVLQALFGASIPISKKLLQYASPFFLAVFIFLFYSCLYKKKRIECDWHHILLYAQIIFFGIYAKYMLRYWSLQYLTATKMAFIFNITPFVAAIFSFIAFHEKITLKQLLGMLIGFVGIIPILLTTSSAEQLVGELFFMSLPELVLLLAIVAHCYGMIITRKLIRDKKQSVGLTNGIRMLGGGLLSLLTAFAFEGFFPVTDVVPFSIGIIVLIVLSNIICHSWYLKLLKTYSVTFLSVTDFLNPLFTASYGWLFLHETITWHYVISTILVFIGMYTFYQGELKSIHTNLYVVRRLEKK